MIKQLRVDLRRISNPIRAKHSQRFFKTGPGQYGENDLFLGPSVPQCRAIAKKYSHLSLPSITRLLKSKYHEERLIALLILVHQFEKGDVPSRKKIYDLYLSSTKHINNWDLVDVTTPKIVGAYLLDKDWSTLKKLARSPNLWERRIAILATFTFTCAGNPRPTLEISTSLLNDKQDLIHKAVGWMLREVGKRCSQKILTDFLDSHLRLLPRTTLRYAIERFPEPLRQKYLSGSIA